MSRKIMHANIFWLSYTQFLSLQVICNLFKCFPAGLWQNAFAIHCSHQTQTAINPKSTCFTRTLLHIAVELNHGKSTRTAGHQHYTGHGILHFLGEKLDHENVKCRAESDRKAPNEHHYTNDGHPWKVILSHLTVTRCSMKKMINPHHTMLHCHKNS